MHACIGNIATSARESQGRWEPNQENITTGLVVSYFNAWKQ
jgi:hypothetical protein